jgi:hypothetical protein
MNRPPDAELQKEYADIIKEDNDPQTVHLLRTLAAGYQAVRPPVSLPPTPADLMAHVDRPRPRFSARRRWSRGFSLSAALVLLIAVAGIAYAVSSITNLGRPTNAIYSNPREPLAGFRRIEGVRRAHGRVEFLWIGSEATQDDFSATLRWPVIKALDQFGTFTGVKAAPQVCSLGCQVPSFDWSHASYRSQYVHFDHRELLDRSNHDYQHLNSWQRRLFVKFAEVNHCGLGPQSTPHNEHERVVMTGWAEECQPGRGLPLRSVGGYMKIRSDAVYPLDLEVDIAATTPTGRDHTSGMGFASIQTALRTGVDPKGSAVVEHVNAETNVLTALICHADGKRPFSVCDRPVIKAILKHVK